MTQYFVDTNIFLRFLTRDDALQYQACKKLLEKAHAGKIKLITSAIVIFEVLWTLQSYYNEQKEQIVEKITSLLDFPNLEVENKEIFHEALAIWQQENVSFNDVFNYVWMQKKGIKKLYSFDKDFDKLPLVSRILP